LTRNQVGENEPSAYVEDTKLIRADWDSVLEAYLLNPRARGPALEEECAKFLSSKLSSDTISLSSLLCDGFDTKCDTINDAIDDADDESDRLTGEVRLSEEHIEFLESRIVELRYRKAKQASLNERQQQNIEKTYKDMHVAEMKAKKAKNNTDSARNDRDMARNSLAESEDGVRRSSQKLDTSKPESKRLSSQREMLQHRLQEKNAELCEKHDLVDSLEREIEKNAQSCLIC
jgi:chromosome segregation ATPase